MKNSRLRGAFTLIELLVVIGIIVVLLGLLMPAFGRMRESGNRAKCASNLHNFGTVCYAFANDHDGVFPVNYMMTDPTYPYRFPLAIPADLARESDPDHPPTKFGATWPSFQQFGAVEGIVDCPSAFARVRYIDSATAPPEWGSVVWTGYMYLGGMTKANSGKSTCRWGRAVPAANLREVRLTERCLAADTVFYSGGADTDWAKAGTNYLINHPQSGNPHLPDFQNILFGDGHVEGKGREWYTEPLTIKNESFRQAPSPLGGYLYWGPGISSTNLGLDAVITAPPLDLIPAPISAPVHPPSSPKPPGSSDPPAAPPDVPKPLPAG